MSFQRCFSVIFGVNLTLLASAGSVFGVSLDEAIRTTLRTNPQIQSALYEISIAGDEMDLSYAGFFPRVDFISTYGIRHQRLDSPAGSDTSDPLTLALQVHQPLFTFGRLEGAYDAGRALLSAEESAQLDRINTIILELITAYVDVLTAREVFELRQNNLEVLRKQLEITQVRMEQGEAILSDVKQAEAAVSAARAQVVRAQGDLEIRSAAFRKIYGEEPGNELEWPELPETVPGSLEEAKRLAYESSPALKAGRWRMDALESRVQEARAGYYPVISAEAAAQSWHGSSLPEEDYSLLLRVDVPVFQSGRTSARVSRAVHQHEQAKTDLDNIGRDVTEELDSAFQSLRVARATYDAFQQNVEAARFAAESFQKEYKYGTRTILDVLQTEQDLLEARVNLALSRRDTIVSGYRLLKTAGTWPRVRWTSSTE